MPETERREMVMAFRRAGGSYRDIAEAVRDHYAEAGREEELPPDWGEAAAYEDVCASIAPQRH